MMPTEKPKPSKPAQSGASLTDLPAQPVDDIEAEEIKGGSTPEAPAEQASGVRSGTPNQR